VSASYLRQSDRFEVEGLLAGSYLLTTFEYGPGMIIEGSSEEITISGNMEYNIQLPTNPQ